MKNIIKVLVLFLAIQSNGQNQYFDQNDVPFVIKFKYQYLDFETIDNLDFLSGNISSFLNEEGLKKLREIENKPDFINTIKITRVFENLTTKDTVSIARQGHKVTIPPFWAVFRLSINGIGQAKEFIDCFSSNRELIEYIHLDFGVNPATIPNDPLFLSNQASLYDPSGMADINVNEAWEITTGWPFVKVAVHDNGVDSIHEDIRVLTGGNYYPSTSLPPTYSWGQKESGIFHGTPVAGIIGARRDNDIGIAGIAGGEEDNDTTGVFIIDIRHPFFQIGNSYKSLTSYICAGVVDAARSVGTYHSYPASYVETEDEYLFQDRKGFGVNLSNHSYYINTNIPRKYEELVKTQDTDGDEVLNVYECGICREAYLFSLQNGVVNVVARGNNNSISNTQPVDYVETLYPQRFPDGWIISVGASGIYGNTIQDDQTLNNGTLSQSQEDLQFDFYSLIGGNMDVVAPGTTSMVYTTRSNGTVSGDYTKFNGTSAAAPHVTGVSALLMSLRNNYCYSTENLTVEDVEYIIQRSAVDLGSPNYDDTSAWGRLDAGAAVHMLADPSKQIIHLDSLVNTTILEEDTISIAYNKAFVHDGWGPISQTIPLTQERQYRVVRTLVENTYYFGHLSSNPTQVLHSWANPSISNSVEKYNDTIFTIEAGPPAGTLYDTWYFDLFDRDPYDSITEINLTNKTVKVVGYYYKFINIYFPNELSVNIKGKTKMTPVIDPGNTLSYWYPSSPSEARMSTSLYLEDPTLTNFIHRPCDSLNIPYDDSIFDGIHLGVENNDLKLKLMPNPTNASFKVEFSGGYDVTKLFVLDALGRELYARENVLTGHNIDMSAFSSGVYLVTLICDERRITKKIIKR